MAAAAAQKANRYVRWHDRLTPEQLEELLAIKASFKSGQTNSSARALAKAIIDDFASNGVEICSLHTVSQWLLEA